MSFRLAKTASMYLFSGLSNEEYEVCERMKIEIESYLQSDRPEELLKLLTSSFTDTVKLGVEESMPVLKNALSLIRHRLIEGSPQEYKKLLMLIDAYVKNCGIRAQVLVGRKKFLETVYDSAKRYSKSVTCPLSLECAVCALQRLEDWDNTFYEYSDKFPHYHEFYMKSRWLGITVPTVEVDKKKVDRIYIDFAAISEKYPKLLTVQ
jgi:hypothetical protein